MKVTLYKNCILNNEYNEVFDITKRKRTVNGVTENYTVFSDYLAMLESTVIELQNMYYTDGMTFTFRIEGDARFSDAYSYNYCKIEVEDLTRYCFINDITLANTVATYSTSEDIWANYAQSMQLRKSYLSNSRALTYANNKKVKIAQLPTDYQTVKPLKYYIKTSTGTEIEATEGEVAIIANLQLYKLGSAGEKTERVCYTILLGALTGNYLGNAFTAKNFVLTPFSKEQAVAILSSIQAYAGNMKVNSYSVDVNTASVFQSAFYEIDNVICVPYNWLENAKEWGSVKIGNTPGVFTSFEDSDMAITFANEFPVADNASYIWDTTRTVIKYDNTDEKNLIMCGVNLSKLFPDGIVDLFSGTVTETFETISVGLRNAQFPFICTKEGKQKDYKVQAHFDRFNYSFYLNFDGQNIDITENLILDIPFDSLTGDVQAQRRLNRIMGTANGVLNIAGGVAQVVGNISGMNAIEKASRMQTVGKRTTTYDFGTGPKGGKYVKSKTTTYNQKRMPSISQSQGSASGVVGGAINMIRGGLQIIEANAPVYSSNSGTFAKSDGWINGSMGICVAKIEPVNTEFVNECVNEMGYEVFEFTDDINDFVLNQNFDDYNIIKFETVNTYGSFPLAIKYQLDDILLSGFKIWYTKDVQ